MIVVMSLREWLTHYRSGYIIKGVVIPLIQWLSHDGVTISLKMWLSHSGCAYRFNIVATSLREWLILLLCTQFHLKKRVTQTLVFTFCRPKNLFWQCSLWFLCGRTCLGIPRSYDAVGAVHAWQIWTNNTLIPNILICNLLHFHYFEYVRWWSCVAHWLPLRGNTWR